MSLATTAACAATAPATFAALVAAACAAFLSCCQSMAVEHEPLDL